MNNDAQKTMENPKNTFEKRVAALLLVTQVLFYSSGTVKNVAESVPAIREAASSIQQVVK